MADPSRRSPLKQAAILAAAAQLVAENGYAPVTVEAIAARAGVGKQTIYRWWDSKAALYVEVYSQMVVVADVPAATDPRDHVHTILRQVFDLYATTPAAAILAGLIADAQRDATARHALVHGLIGGRGPVLIQPLRQACQAGVLPPPFDPDWAAEMAVALIWKRVLSGGVLDGDFADRIVAAIFPAENRPCR
ncbi:MAG: TetR/AcrR family transcriptional regulator [Magnetospirillum sp.]